MKKYLICIITAILLFSCLSMTAFAENTAPTISDDYQTIYINGETYSRFNASLVGTSYYTYDITPELTDTQQENITAIDIEMNDSRTILSVQIGLKDGSTLSANYIREDYLQTYNDLTTDPNSPYTIDFFYPLDNTVTGSKSDFMGTPVALSEYEIYSSNYFDVFMTLNEDSSIYSGSLLIIDDSYYYVDYEENGVLNWSYFDLYEYTELAAYEITDSELVANIQAGEEAYYGDDYSFFYDDELTNSISSVFLILIFAVVPAIILVLFFIFALRSKGIYRRLFAVICGCAGAELIIFTIVTTMLY